MNFLKYTFGWPAAFKAVPSCRVTHAEQFNPITQAMAFPKQGDNTISSRIGGLLFSCAPLAITRLVIAIIVTSIYGMLSGWRISHICKKAFKVIPSFTHLNPASSVIVVCGIILILTSLEHSMPNFPDSITRLSVCLVVLDLFFQRGTTTTINCARFQARSVCPPFLSAITLTSVSSVRFYNYVIRRQYNQFAKSHPGQNICFKHRNIFSESTGFSNNQNGLHI